jgi:hypothetical protein
MSSASAESPSADPYPAVRREPGALLRPVVIGGRRLPPILLLVVAAIGAVLLVVVASTSWGTGSDELAYWRAAQRLVAGQPLYDPAAVPNTPYAYWNPPPLAQALAPLTGLLSPEAFTAIWTALLLVCLWWLGGRSVVVGLALVAFLPVAVELRTRNLHLVLAVLVVLALRRSWIFWVPATALKISPVLGGLFLLAAGRIREAVLMGVVGGVVLAVSVVLAPGAWSDFFAVVGGRAGSEGGALIAVPFWARFGIGAVLAVLGGWLARRSGVHGATGGAVPDPGAGWTRDGRLGEVILVVGLTVANPTLWATALSLLVAVVPVLRTRPADTRVLHGRAVTG